MRHDQQYPITDKSSKGMSFLEFIIFRKQCGSTRDGFNRNRVIGENRSNRLHIFRLNRETVTGKNGAFQPEPPG